MNVMTVNEVTNDLSHILNSITNSHEIIQIDNKQNSGVLLSKVDWEAIKETLALSSIPNMKESIIEGLNTPIEDCHKDLEW